MPLRVNDGVLIPVTPPSTSLLLENVTILPEDGLLGPGPEDERLDIPWFRQRKEMWCWVACAQMVLRFFGTFLNQCEIAQRQLHKPCCNAFTPAYCDEGCTAQEIDQAFTRIGLAGLRLDEPASFPDIHDEITSERPRPVVAGVTWAGGGGHLVVISGARRVNDIRYVRVHDPIYGPGDIRYTDLRDFYGPNDNGKWSHTWLNFERQ